MPVFRLRFKINAAIAITCIFVALFFAGIVYPYELNRRNSRFEEIQTLVSAVFEQRREEIANEIYAKQNSALASSLNSIKGVKGISKVIVYGTDGAALAATETGLDPMIDPSERKSLDNGPGIDSRNLAGHPYAVYASPIEVIGEKVGYIKLYYDLGPQSREGWYTIAVFLLLLTSTLVLIALLSNILLTRLVLKPTFMLRNAILQLQGGKLGEQVPLVSRDEIGEVAGAFNQMSSLLNDQREELIQALQTKDDYAQKLEVLNASLESMVEKRTSELVESNVRLQQEIRERIRTDDARKELEERLARSQKMEVLGLLAGGVAHDLNNVLSGVVSYPDLLLMDMADNHPLRKAMTTIRSSGLKATAIVQDMLALARRGVMQTSVLDMNVDIIQDYLASPEFDNLQAQHPDIRLETHLDPDLRRIKGSSVHIKKSLMNLIINAMEAQPQGGSIRIFTFNTYLDAPLDDYGKVSEGEYVLLRIEDDGVGIRPEDLKRIFEPFYTKKEMGRSGTGLGMAVVWGTIQDHNGCITVRSMPGKGSTFDLFFPITTEERLPACRSIPTSEYMGRGERVLVVDDLEEQRQLVSEILRKLNYCVETAHSGEAAVEYLKTHTADLVLLDMIMEPGMDGLDTYRKIIELHPGQKAIIASGYSENERVVEAMKLGVGRYIRKPYTIENLGKALREEQLKSVD